MAVPGEVTCFCQELTGAASFAYLALSEAFDSGMLFAVAVSGKTNVILLHRR